MLKSLRNKKLSISVICVFTIILFLCSDETNSARVSRKRSDRSIYSERRHHHLKNIAPSDENISSELRRSGRFICTEDDDEKARLESKKEMHCKCPNLYAPVCGNDGVTYHNRCFMKCTSEFKYEGFSRVKLQVIKWGPCDPDHEMEG